MSDEQKDLQIESKSNADILPIIEGVNKIAEFTVDKTKKLENKITDAETKFKNEIHGVNEKVERGFHDMIDRLDDISKRTSFSGRFNFQQDDMAALKSAIPERFRKNWNAYEMAATKNGKRPTFEETVTFALQDVYYKNTSKMSLREFTQDRENLNRETKEFLDVIARVEKADMGGLVDTSGGYAVPNIVGNEVLKIVRDASLIYNRARQLPMTSDTLSFPDENTAVTINWSNTDGTALTAGEPVFGVKTLNARKLMGRATFSLELLDDANVAIVPFLQSCFAEKMGGELDFQAMEGVGTPFTGVSGATSVSDAGATNGTNGVVLAYNPTGTTKGNLVKIFTKAGEGSAINGGTWVCGPGVYAQIIGLVDGNGQPIVKLGTVEGQPNNTLLGRPIIVSNRLGLTTVGAGTVSVGGLYYGPMSALLFGTRQGMRWDVTDQVNWAKYQADARMVGRFAFVVGVPTAWTKQASIIV